MTFDRETLASHQTIQITTFGRLTGEPRRIEIWWFRIEGRFVITGTPGKRDWLANVTANPRLIVHVEGHDIEATASLVEDAAFRRRAFTQRETSWYASQAELDLLVSTAPMIEIHLPD
jgi:deazaflavin-dependent oxidoreductase (nitroreductase family)